MDTPKTGQSWQRENQRIKLTRVTRHQVWYEGADGSKGWALVSYLTANFYRVKSGAKR